MKEYTAVGRALGWVISLYSSRVSVHLLAVSFCLLTQVFSYGTYLQAINTLFTLPFIQTAFEATEKVCHHTCLSLEVKVV